MLKRLTLSGFKSIKTINIELHPLNILIGANGAGKSNLISFFKMLNEMMAGRFQQYIGTSGRAQSLLHFGPRITPQIEAELEFQVDNGIDTYHIRLFHAAGDTLIFAEETLSFLETGRGSPKVDELGAGHQETQIPKAAEEGKQTARTLRYLLNRCRVYHFHDTSSTADVRQSCYVGDNRWLMPDAGNLAALLLRFRDEDSGLAYQRIIGTIRLIAPFFDDFVLCCSAVLITSSAIITVFSADVTIIVAADIFVAFTTVCCCFCCYCLISVFAAITVVFAALVIGFAAIAIGFAAIAIGFAAITVGFAAITVGFAAITIDFTAILFFCCCCGVFTILLLLFWCWHLCCCWYCYYLFSADSLVFC